MSRPMIRIDDDYIITVDTNNYTLCLDRHKLDKDGELVMSAVGYYSTLQQAVRGCVKHKCKNTLSTLDTDLNGAIRALSDVVNGFEDMLRKAIRDEDDIG